MPNFVLLYITNMLHLLPQNQKYKRSFHCLSYFSSLVLHSATVVDVTSRTMVTLVKNGMRMKRRTRAFVVPSAIKMPFVPQA